MGGLDYNEAEVEPFETNVEMYAHLIPKADTIGVRQWREVRMALILF
jgi:hypothetical protein